MLVQIDRSGRRVLAANNVLIDNYLLTPQYQIFDHAGDGYVCDRRTLKVSKLSQDELVHLLLKIEMIGIQIKTRQNEKSV